MKRDNESRRRQLCIDIVEWGERIPHIVGSMDFDQFEANQTVYLAVWKCVEVLGEAASKILKIDPEFATRHPNLQLKQAYAMRNQLTHGYGEVDLRILWQTIHNFTPSMVAAAKEIAAADRGRG